MAANDGGKFSWNVFNIFSGNKSVVAPGRAPSNNGPTLDNPHRQMDMNETKRKRSPVTTKFDEESPGKRRRRDSPPQSRASGMPLSGRSASVKALNLHDSNGRHPPLSSMRSEASFTSARSNMSRGTSTGLAFQIDNLKLQTASPTPAPEWSNLKAPRAGVSSHAYNVSQRLGSVDMAIDSATPGPDAQRGLTPTGAGATFGAMRSMLDGSRNTSRSPVSISNRSTNKRNPSNGSWVSRSGSVKAPRFGDSSLSSQRNRTTSLISVTTSAYASSSNTSANGEGRTTPTPGDNGLSSPSVISPSSSSVGSPPPAPAKPLSLQAQRAMERLADVDTPLRQSFSFTGRAPMRKVKVPMPSKKSLSYGRSSDASSSRHSHSQTESGDAAGKPAKSETQGHQRTASGPYAIGRDRASGKKILDKRRAEEKDLQVQRATSIPENIIMEEVDLHVEPIKKGKGDASPLDAVMQGDTPQSKRGPAKTTANRLTPSIDSASNSGTSSRTVGKSQLRIGREKKNHQQSASVTSMASHAPPPSVSTGRASSLAPSENRTRIPASEIPSRFNPMNNERLNRATSTGRYSLSLNDDEEDMSQEKEKQTRRPSLGPTLSITDNMKNDREKTPEKESPATPMNISPVKESFKRTDSDASDIMSTTPTESSMRNAFSMTPMVPASQDSTAPSLPSNPFTKVETPSAPPVSFGFTPVPAPVAVTKAAESKPLPFPFVTAPAPVVESNPAARSPFSFGAAPLPVQNKPAAPSPFSFNAPLPDEDKPRAQSPFSFGKAPTPAPAQAPAPVEAKPSMSGFSFLPTPGASQPAASGFSFPSLTSKPAFPPAVAEPVKKEAASPFSFSASPLPTLSVSPPPPEASKEAPKPFSFGSIAPSAPIMPAVKAAPAPAPFSFGQSTPTPSAAIPVSTTPATPSPVKPLFSFPGSTPAQNISTTPQSSPFSFGESPSPVKSLSLGAPLEIKTPIKDNNTFSFRGPSTTPAATPAQQPGFSFGNGNSTTPAATPSAPFSFGATPSTSSPAVPFTFGAPVTASTTPAVTPIQTTGFSFANGGGVNHPFTSQTTPTANRGFNFGGDSAPAPSTTPLFSFGTPGDATPKGSHTPGGSFSFGAPAPANTGFSFGAPPTTTGAPGPVFPNGPTTPTTKLLELDSMDSSPIRGGGTGTTNGTSFSAANTGSGFSFGAGATNSSNNNGFGQNPTAPSLNTTNSGFGAQAGSGFGAGFGREASPAPSPSTFSFGGNSIGSGPGGFGQPPASTPFGQNAPSSFGQNNGFSFSQPNSATSASPFNQAQALPSPALGGFAQLSSPASSPFLTPVGLGSANPFGPPQGQKRAADDQSSDGLGGERKIAPMPRSRKPKTEAERRAALQRAHHI